MLDQRDPAVFRIAVLGLWTFTNLELAYALLRVDERARAYAIAAVANVLLTIALTVYLVVLRHQQARGLLLGNYAASTVVLLGAVDLAGGAACCPRRGGASHPRLHRLADLLRFGLPTVPADASVYALNLVDRYYLFHRYGAATAGVYSIAVKLAGVTAFVARAFQYSWPPLAYSIRGRRGGRPLLRVRRDLLPARDRLARRRAAAARPLVHETARRARSTSTRTRRCRGSRSAGRSTACS